MAGLWGGKASDTACPKIESLKLDGPGEGDAAPDALVKASLKATSPAGDPLTVKWALYPEDHPYSVSAEGSELRVVFPDAIVKSSETGAEVKMPKGGGAYRLCVYVFDKHGGAATGNICLYVKGPVIALKLPGQKAKLPFKIIGDDAPAAFGATGVMGNTQRVNMDSTCTDKPHSGATCLKVSYKAGDLWAGVVWQDPPGDWGDLPGGYDFTGATKLTFWARGAAGGEKVMVGVGLLKEKKYDDSAVAEIPVTLTTDWKQYTIDLAGKDLTCIKSGFRWTVAGQGKPVVFYLDDVQFEK